MIDTKLISKIFANDQSINMIDFSYQDINDNDLEKICNALTNNIYVNTFLANSCSITDRGAYRVAELLRINPHIQRVEIARNKRMSDECIKNIAKEFKNRFYKKKGLCRLALNNHHHLKDIDTIDNISSEDFLNNYFNPQRPLIVRGAIKQTDACQNWSFQYFIKTMADKEIPLTIRDIDKWSINNTSSITSFSTVNMKMHQALSLLEDPACMNTLTKRFYLQQHPMNHFPEIQDDISLPTFSHGIKYKLMMQNLWVSQKDYHTPLHFDWVDNILTQIQGEKSILLYPPEDINYLCPYQPKKNVLLCNTHTSRIPNVDVLDSFYDKTRHATPYHSKITAGDALFIPKGWWHDIRTLSSPSISVNFWLANVEIIPEIENLIMGTFFKKNSDKNIIIQCAKILINLNKPNYLIRDQSTSLQLATTFNLVNIVKLLLTHPAIEPNITSISNRYTPLYLAIKFGNLEILDLLIKHKSINIYEPFINGQTPLSLAQEEKRLHIITRLRQV